MPTGYTAGVADGSVTEFKDYALMCARNFGALILLRDEPLSPEIPVFEPSTFSRDRLEKAKQELSAWQVMTEVQRREVYSQAMQAKREANERIRDRNATTRRRYCAMLEKARQFRSPSREHDNYAKFLVSQLEESISWDCDNMLEDDEVPFDVWMQLYEKDLLWSIEYHTKQWKEEQDRTACRNEWVRQLREAIELVK